MNTADLGGAETFTLDLIRNTEDTDISYTLCYFRSSDSRPAEFRAAGAELIALDAKTSPPQLDPTIPAKFLNVARTAEFDILHAHMPYPQVLSRLAASSVTDAKVVSTQHTRRDGLPAVSRGLQSATASLDAKTVAVSEGVRRSYDAAEEPHRRWTTIHNGIGVDSFHRRVAESTPPPAADGGGPVFLNVGRYVPEKHQQCLIDAMVDVRRELPDARAILVGYGPLEAELRDRAADRGLSEAVTVTGPSSEVERYYRVADAFVLSSVREGLPITGLEAMAAKLPVVGTRIAGIEDIVEDGTTGRLVPPRAPGALADAMVAMGEESVRRRLGEQGFRRARERFHIGAAVEEYLELYRSVAATAHPGEPTT